MRALRPSPSSLRTVEPPPDPTRFDTPPPDSPVVHASGRMHRSKSSVSTGFTTSSMILFLAAHVPLATLMSRYPTLATVHALAVFGLGLWWAGHGGKLDRVTLVVGYLAGGEVLWRMTEAQVNWEFGKYAAAVVLILALLRNRAHMPSVVPLGYFALLMPSVTLTLNNLDWSVARNQISFNLSGPFALMICAWFFSQIRMTNEQIRTLFITMIGPAIGVASIAVSSTFSGTELFFSDNSNFATSGGFGPNQVSAVLGMGAMLSFFLMASEGIGTLGRVALGAAMVGLATQSALTFSRGGLYMAAGGIGVAACFAATDVKLRARLVGMMVVLLMAANYFVIPYVDAFTEGQLGVRFQDTYLTGRDRMIRADIELWKENPIFGVGPGEARAFRAEFGIDDDGLPGRTRSSLAHTEFSRMLSEHGLFGFLALLLLLLAAVMNVRKQTDVRGRALVAGLTMWSMLFMLSYATRVLAPSLAFGLGFAMMNIDPSKQLSTARRSWMFGFSRGRRIRTLTAGHPAAAAQ